MEIKELINHPERMDRDTLYELRSMLALYPYFQTVRLLMLQNLYLLHDSEFDEELRRAAVYVSDRKTIFQMIEAAHYVLRQQATGNIQQPSSPNRTIDLIDSFLNTIPQDEAPAESPKRKPTAADAAVDYVAYLLAAEDDEPDGQPTPQMKGQDLIDSFLQQEQGRILLSQESEDPEESEAEKSGDENVEEEYFTETLARIYIKQGRYQRALDIITRLSERYPKKNVYFADQIRFLEKLIINSNNKNKK